MSDTLRGGTLFVVATPIGNLADLTYRAAATLQQVEAVLAEDTRQTKKLLNHYEINARLVSYHAHTSPSKQAEILDRLVAGESLALVTDAGTPAISDPGSALVAAARQAGHEVIPIPGPSAVPTALSAAGMGGDTFTFLGFLPHKKGRQTALEKIAELIQPVVLYESPYRLVKLLGELTEHYPEALVCVARELTKVHEEFRQGAPQELHAWYTERPPRGEIVVIVRYPA